jgi:pyroglutamyl-peptidase
LNTHGERNGFYRKKAYKNMMSLWKKSCIVVVFVLIVPLVSARGTDARVVLVTGFEPFGSQVINPSQLIAEALNGSMLDGAEVIGVVLPVDFNRSVEEAIQTIQSTHPDLVVSLGLDARAKTIEVEKIGINLKRYQKDDGSWSFLQRIDKKGPFLRMTTLPTRDIARNIRDRGIPAKQSFFAGLYVCNALYYGLLGYTMNQMVNTTVLFIHVPLLDSQDPHGVSLEVLIEAVKIAIQTSLHSC